MDPAWLVDDRPAPGALFAETWTEFRDHLGWYALGKLGQLALLAGYLAAGFAVVQLVALALGFFGLGLALVAVATASELGAELGRSLLVALSGAVGAAGYGFVLWTLAAVGVGLVAAAVPLHLSLCRAVATQQRGGAVVTAVSCVSAPVPMRVAGDLVAAVVLLIAASTVTAGIPLLVALVVFGFVPTVVGLLEVEPWSASQQCLQALRRDPAGYLAVSLAATAIWAVGWLVPVVGPAFALAYRVRAARRLLCLG